MPIRNDVKELAVMPEANANVVSFPPAGSYGAPNGNRAGTVNADRRAPANPGIVPRFTAEEAILLRGLAAGNSVKEVARQLRLSRPSLFRLLGDLRSKTGVVDDVALAVWVVRHMKTHDQRSCRR